MRLTFKEARIQQDDGLWLCLKVNEPAPARGFVLGKKNRLYDCDLTEHREKRSLDANGLLWVMLGKISEAIGATKEELYLGYVKEHGPFKDFSLTEGEAKTFRVAWSALGIGWPTEQVDYSQDGERVIIRAYYGSSTYNTKQMSRMLDAIIQDAKSVGIDTLSERELSLIKEEWHGSLESNSRN